MICGNASKLNLRVRETIHLCRYFNHDVFGNLISANFNNIKGSTSRLENFVSELENCYSADGGGFLQLTSRD